MSETWKSVIGYEGLYEVSNLGRVRSLIFGKSIRILSLNTHGYLNVGLYKNRKCKFHTVHQLVANAFIPNPEHKKNVHHKSEVKTDNRQENLEWVTTLENQNYYYQDRPRYFESYFAKNYFKNNFVNSISNLIPI